VPVATKKQVSAGWAVARAEQWLAADQAPSMPDGAEARRAVAWALKDICYAAWNSAPDRAVRAAAALRTLAGAGADPEVGALAEWTAGIAQITQGQLQPAIDCFDAAAEAFHRIGRARDAALTQVPKIMALSMLGQHTAAAECAEVTQRAFVAERDLLAAAKVSLNLGSLHMLRDAYAQAVRHYREAAVHFARAGDREHSVMADLGLADALTALGDFDESLRTYARARMRAQAHGLAVLEAHVDESVALLQYVRGRYPEALAGMEQARRRYEALAMPQRLAVAEKQLADTYLELNLLPEALAQFDAAIATFERLGLLDEQAWTMAQRGRTLALMGRATPAAEALADAALRLARQGNVVGEAAVALTRAEVALQAGDTAAAKLAAERAAGRFAAEGRSDAQLRAELVVAESALLEGHAARARALFDATLARAEQMQLVAVQMRCWTGKGLAADALGDAAAARVALEAAVELFEDQRAALPDSELRSAFLADHLKPFRALLRLELRAHDHQPGAAGAVAVLAQLERVRARAMGEQLAHGETAHDDERTPALRVRLNWLIQRVQRQRDDGEPSTVLADELRATERELLERVRRRRIASPLSRPAGPRADPEALASLSASLDEGDALVEYGVLDDELFACIVTRSGVVLQRRMASWVQVREALRSTRFQVETLRHGPGPMARHLDTLHRRMHARLAQLHALVWAPLAEALAACRRVLIVPHGPLGSLPFAALHADGNFLAERHQIAVAPSARLALHARQRQAASPRRALVVGESSRLPHAAVEARHVAALFDEARVLIGGDATLAQVRAHLGEADVLHLACHAQFRSDNPRFSALHLVDGALTAEATEALPLRAGICVLSACETGLSDYGEADDMVGLVRAFMTGGAARVLASLWPVDDAVTAGYMKAFYCAMRAGAPAAAAVQQAQQAVREAHPHPFYWSAFALYGGW
jgi:tetratricopeptide (TPR) repeat protein